MRENKYRKEVFQSTPSARRATAEAQNLMIQAEQISIHALREESDTLTSLLPISARSFQSTPSARRATKHGIYSQIHHKISIHALREESDGKPNGNGTAIPYFNPRPPRGERPGSNGGTALTDTISIHALREESDRNHSFQIFAYARFQSTPSARRATRLY